jgi:phosphoglycerate dehydrogenase-like enzyme
VTMRCAILDDFQGVAAGLADWSGVDLVVLREHLTSEQEIVAAIEDCEIVVAMRERTPFPASLFARLPNLRLLITTGWRNASIDLAAAAEHGVTVCGTGSASEPPAELTWALILGLARGLVTEAESVRRNGPWQSTVGTDLYGARLGLIGLGKIGGRMAAAGRAFGMDVVAWSQNLTDERAAEVGARRVTLDELLETSDFVSIHLTLSDRTRGLLGADQLARMRSTAYLINTSRSAIVDSDALLAALRAGWIAGAGLDVFDTEPLPADDELRKLPNVLATPHLGYVTERNYRMYFTEAVEDIHAFLAGKPIRVFTA